MKLQEKVVPANRNAKEFLQELSHLASSDIGVLINRPLGAKLGKELDGFKNIIALNPLWKNWDVAVGMKIDNVFVEFSKSPKDFIFFSLEESA